MTNDWRLDSWDVDNNNNEHKLTPALSDSTNLIGLGLKLKTKNFDKYNPTEARTLKTSIFIFKSYVKYRRITH